jgi:tetratricopeptide (TPR) repeat protein
MSVPALLTLILTTHNDAATVAEAVASVKPFIDRYVVVDTGSKDGTKEALTAALEGLEGQIVDATFKDFASTANAGLDLLGEGSFALLLSGHEKLVDGEALRKELAAQLEGKASGAHQVRVKVAPTGKYLDETRVVRGGSGYRWTGAAHPILAREKGPVPTHRIPGTHIEVLPRDPKAERSRLQLERRLLDDELKASPNDARTAFFLAYTLESLGDTKKAYFAYEKRAKMGGWQEEVFEALLGLGRTAQAVGKSWAEAQQHFLDAHTHSPQRAEAMFAIAWHYYQAKNHVLTYLFASRAAELPIPEKAALFVEPDVYETRLLDLVGTAAYYVGEFEAGEAALRQALSRRPGDARFEKNLAFYESKRKSSLVNRRRQPPAGKKRPPRPSPGDEGGGFASRSRLDRDGDGAADRRARLSVRSEAGEVCRVNQLVRKIASISFFTCSSVWLREMAISLTISVRAVSSMRRSPKESCLSVFKRYRSRRTSATS